MSISFSWRNAVVLEFSPGARILFESESLEVMSRSWLLGAHDVMPKKAMMVLALSKNKEGFMV